MKVNSIKPFGYCFGVINAINIALKAKLENKDKNIIIFGMLVHNEEVIKMLESEGIKTFNTDNIDKIEALKRFNQDDLIIFTAHGHLKIYDSILDELGIKYIDATCPIVKKNIDVINEYTLNNQVIFIGKKNHPETEASLINDNVILYDINEGIDYSKVKSTNPLITNQTTLSFLEIEKIHKELKEKIKDAKLLDEICNATRIRQTNILNINDTTDVIIIVGDKKSSNTDKLYLLAKEKYLDKLVIKVESLVDLVHYNLKNYNEISITSGTSTPLTTIEEIIKYLEDL